MKVIWCLSDTLKKDNFMWTLLAKRHFYVENLNIKTLLQCIFRFCTFSVFWPCRVHTVTVTMPWQSSRRAVNVPWSWPCRWPCPCQCPYDRVLVIIFFRDHFPLSCLKWKFMNWFFWYIFISLRLKKFCSKFLFKRIKYYQFFS